jgi:hypothetical protein
MSVSCQGAGTAAAVVNDQTGPVVVPALLRAVTCQKYCVLAATAGGAYEAVVNPLAAAGGGFAVPKATS